MSQKLMWWLGQDLNLQPFPYERTALTLCATEPQIGFGRRARTFIVGFKARCLTVKRSRMKVGLKITATKWVVRCNYDF